MKKQRIFFALILLGEGYFCWQEWAIRPLGLVAFLLAAFFFLGVYLAEEEEE